MLIPAVLVPWLVMSGATSLAFASPQTIGGILIAVAPLFAWLGPSMIVGNLLVAAIPTARRVLDAEAAPFPGTDRRSANRDLLKVSIFMTPAGLFVALLGTLARL